MSAKTIAVIVAILGSFSLVLAQSQEGHDHGPAADNAMPIATKAAPAESQPTSQPNKPLPKLRCDAPTFNFNESWEGDKITHVFELFNDGEGTLEITNVRAGCGCTATEYDKSIAPHKSGKIKAIVTTTNMRDRISKPITVKTNDTETPEIILKIEGKIKNRITIDPPMGASWGRVGQDTPDSELTKIVKLTNNTDEKMKLEPQPINEEAKVYETEISEVEPGKVVELKISAKKPLTEGTSFFQLKFNTGMKAQPEVMIPCRLLVPPMVEVIPDSIMLGSTVTREYKRIIQLRYNGQGTLKVESAVSSDPKILVDVKENEKDPGRLYQITLTLPAGLQITNEPPTEITITTDNANRPKIVVPIRMYVSPPTSRQAQSVLVPESLLMTAAPSEAVKTVEGQERRIGAGNNKVSLIAFWTSWSKPSVESLSMLQRIDQQYRRKEVDVFSVNADRLRQTSDILETLKLADISLPLLLDSNNAASKYGVKQFPAFFLTDKGGTVQAVHRGISEQLEEDIKAELELLLADKTRADMTKKPVIAGPFSIAMDYQQDPSGSTSPAILLESMRLDVGKCKPGQPVKYKVYYRNVGQKQLSITAITPGEPLKLSSEYTKALEPNATGSFQVEFTAPKRPGEFSHLVTIESNDPKHPKLPVTLTAISRAYVEVDPAAGIDFSNKPQTHSLPRLATLTYNGTGKVQYGKPESSSPRFEAEIQPINDTPYAKLTVKAIPPFEPGENTATLHITTDCQEQPAIDVPVTLTVPPRIELVPPRVMVRPAPRIQQASVAINNTGEGSLNILSVKPSSDKISTQFFPEADGKSYRLQLTFAPDFDPGAQGEKVVIRTDDEQLKEIVVPIQVGQQP